MWLLALGVALDVLGLRPTFRESTRTLRLSSSGKTSLPVYQTGREILLGKAHAACSWNNSEWKGIGTAGVDVGMKVDVYNIVFEICGFYLIKHA